MELNIRKSKYMCFGIYKNTCLVHSPLVIHFSKCNRSLASCIRDELEHVDSIKYLGVLFNRNLRWSLHINNVVNMVQKLKCKMLKDILNAKTLRAAYSALVQSIYYLWYCYLGKYI